MQHIWWTESEVEPKGRSLWSLFPQYWVKLVAKSGVKMQPISIYIYILDCLFGLMFVLMQLMLFWDSKSAVLNSSPRAPPALHISYVTLIVSVLCRVCTVTEDQTKTVSGVHPVLFSVLKSFYFVPVFVYVCPAAWKSSLVIPAIAHCKSAWEFGGIAVSPLATSPHARRSREISVAGGGSPKPAGSLPSSRVATPPGAPFAGDHATGSPLTQAHRIATDSSPPDRRWLKPTGSALIHARWPPLSLAPWIKSTCHGQECRVCFVVPTGTF